MSQVSLTPLINAQGKRKMSTPTPGAQGPLPFLEGALESSTHRLYVIETPESSKGTLVPSAHTQSELEPSASSPGSLRPSQSFKGRLRVDTIPVNTLNSKEEGPQHPSKFRKFELPQTL